MELRDIRLEQFAAWEHVQIAPLDAGLNVIFLDDDARPIDFSRFLHGVVAGFEPKRGQTTAGSMTFVRRDRASRRSQLWRLDRHARRDGQQTWQIQIDGDEPSTDVALLRQLSGGLPPEYMERLFLPTADLDETSKAERWNWLARQTQLCEDLFATDVEPSQSSPVDHPTLREMASVSLTSHGRVLEDLGKQRDVLLEKIAEMRAKPRQTKQTPKLVSKPIPKPKPPPASAPKIHREVPRETTEHEQHLIADTQEELRQLGLQLPPMRLATELADRWRELKLLQREVSDESKSRTDLDRMKATLSEYQLLEDEKQDYRKTLAKPKSSSRSKGRRSDEHTVRRLLEQRDWVTQACARPVAAYDITSDQYDELRHASHLLQSARRDHERSQRRLAEFARRTSFDWSRLFEDPIARVKSEIAADSPVHREPPPSRLAELKRRRLWVREEHRSLLGRQEFQPQIHTWLAILVTLSICAILGTLLATTSLAQWMMLAFGLGGLVSSGALKLSLELRSSRKLNRAKDRLQQIDAEVLALTEEIMSDKQDDAALRRRAEERLYAIQLQEDATEENRRLDSAESSFRELLDVHGLPLHLSPGELERTLKRRQPKSIRSGSSEQRQKGNSRLRKWIKKARDTAERIDGIRPGKDPIDLLSTLEMLFDRLRDQVHSKGGSDRNEVDAQFARQIRNDAREQLRLLEKRQRQLLRRFKVDDQFALESAIETMDLERKKRVRADRLERELATAIDMHDDPEDVREFLDAFDAQSLRTRLSESIRRQTELQAELTRLQAIASKPRAPLPVETELEVPVEAIEESELHEAEVPTVTQVTVLEADPNALELDRLRLQLAVVQTKIRKSLRWSQSAATLRRVAQSLIDRKPAKAKPSASSVTMPFLSKLTSGRWQAMAKTPQGIVLQNGRTQASLSQSRGQSHDDSDLAWLALRLTYAEWLHKRGRGFPLIFLADSLFDSPNAVRTFEVLRDVAAAGVQCLLLSSDRQIANQLTEGGAPLVRVGLREGSARRIPAARSSVRKNQSGITTAKRSLFQLASP